MSVKIKLKRGSESSLSGIVPDVGEPAYDTSNNVLKIGDGTSNFENLPTNVISNTGVLPEVVTTGIINMVVISSGDYNTITKDPNTLYFIPIS